MCRRWLGADTISRRHLSAAAPLLPNCQPIYVPLIPGPPHLQQQRVDVRCPKKVHVVHYDICSFLVQWLEHHLHPPTTQKEGDGWVPGGQRWLSLKGFEPCGISAVGASFRKPPHITQPGPAAHGTPHFSQPPTSANQPRLHNGSAMAGDVPVRFAFRPLWVALQRLHKALRCMMGQGERKEVEDGAMYQLRKGLAQSAACTRAELTAAGCTTAAMEAHHSRLGSTPQGPGQHTTLPLTCTVPSGECCRWQGRPGGRVVSCRSL